MSDPNTVNPLFPNPTILPGGHNDKLKISPKFEKVMKEFGKRELKSSTGDIVRNPKQAVAIAASESGQAFKKRQSDQKKADRFGMRRK